MSDVLQRVLVIEDDPDFRSLMCSALETAGYEAIAAENGRVGVALAVDALPSIVLCDISMPELDGHDTLLRLRTLEPTRDVPFVFISARSEHNDVRQGMNLGADDYLVKPFTPEELIDTVRARLQRHGERRSRPSGVAPVTPLALPRESPPARVADRYELTRRVAEGGMGSIYLARDVRSGRDVAVKLVPRTLTSADRFLRECEALAGLHHPRVVPYLEHGDEGESFHYLVMDWLKGHDLAKRLEAGPLRALEARRVLRHAAEALAYVHAAGVLHRDVKPGNLFLVNGDIESLTLIDFGLARVLESAPVTHSGMLLGTPGYLAPEQVNEGASPTPRCDVFSLGCVGYECLAGVAPFFAPNPIASLARLMLEESPRLRERSPDVPEALDELVASMMQREPAARLSDGQAVIDAMNAAGL